MKTYTLFALICLSLLTPSLFGQTASDQLQQLTAQLQNSPNDDALRGKIIALALTLTPKPAAPIAATQAEGAAEYIFKNAKVTSDYSDAAKQYEKALLRAPWLASDYFNCGVAHEKAGENKEAIRSFNFYLLAEPNADDVQAVNKRIGGLQYAEVEANSTEGKAEKEYGPAQRQFTELIHKLDGGIFIKDKDYNGLHFYYEVRFYKTGRYNLLKYHHREKMVNDHPIGNQNPGGVWEDKEEGYVSPTNGLEGPYRGYFMFPPMGGQEFFLFFGCGRLSADGKTIDEINHNSREQEVIGVWHRQ